MAGKGSLSPETEIVTTKEDSSADPESSTPPGTSRSGSASHDNENSYSSSGCCQESDIEDVSNNSSSSEQLDAYEEYQNDLLNEADESEDSVKATYKDGYYFDDDFKLS